MTDDPQAPPAPSEPNVGAWQPGPAGPLEQAGRPELAVGAAFAGGLLTALLLRRLGGDD